MDYGLPDATGTQGLRKLHALLGASMPPTIIMTAGDVEAAAISAVRSGAVDFLAKRDVSSAVLKRTVGNAIETGRLKRSVLLRGQQLEAANDELMKRNEEIENFYHTVSHEIKTPLAATREFVSILSDELLGPINSRQQEMLSHATECCDQISAQFNDLLDLTRLETGKFRLEKRMQPLRPLIERCVVVANISAEPKNVKINASLPENLPEFNLDRARINQVLSNLLNNAIKFTPEGGAVTLESAYESVTDELEFRVIDTGCGIAPQHLDRVFDRLYQIENELNTESNGLGLGLAIATRIVVQHGGSLSVESEQGIGSTFVVCLVDVTKEDGG
jgi:signal transduction histidine kinase